MADVTISSLPLGTPSSSALLPYSQGGSTLSVSPSALLQNVGNIGIGLNNPNTKLHVAGDITCINTVNNGVRTLYFSGQTPGNQTINLPDIYMVCCSPIKAHLAFDHWYANGYAALRECYISVTPYATYLTANDIINISSGASGSWQMSRPQTSTSPDGPRSNKLLIYKTAGTYEGTSSWWAKLECNASVFNLYSAI